MCSELFQIIKIVYLVVFSLKDDIPVPIFTLDARRGDNLERAPQSTLSDLGKRAYFNMANKPAFLQAGLAIYLF